MPKVLLCALLAFSPLWVQAEIYRWVDDSGVTHFSDDPPPDVEAQAAELPRLIIVPGTSEFERRRLEEIAAEEEAYRQRRDAARQARRERTRARTADHKACESVRNKIENIRDEMRRGYSVKRGEVLERRLVTLRAEVREVCP